MRAKIGAATVAIERGDISLIEADAVVNAANTELAMGTGVAGALKKRGGVVIEEEAMRQGPIEVGAAVLTTAGNLAATHVIHAAAMGPDLKTDATKIGAATKSALQLAEKHRITSIAFPGLGTGVGGFPPANAADAIMTTVLDHLKSGGSTLRRVIFVLYQDEAYKAFTDALKRASAVK